MLLASYINPYAANWRQRYSLVGLCFCAVLICYIDRVNISVAIIPMAEQYGWGATVQGWVLSSFFVGYLTTQFLGGYLADKFGGKVVLAVGVIWWSTFTILTPPAATMGISVLIATRILMGIGEGVTIPAIFSLYSKWVPAAERSRSVAFTVSGMPIGQVCALLIAPVIALYFGWEWIFYLFGALGIIWYFFWQRAVTSYPSNHLKISEEEKAEISAGTEADVSVGTAPSLKSFSRSLPVWAIIIAHFTFGWSVFVLLTWLPSYVNQELGVDFANAGWVSMLPHITYFICLNFAGLVADRMVKQGMAIVKVRKICQTIACIGLAGALCLVGQIDSAWLAMTIMCIGYGLGAFNTGGFGINHLDIAPNHAGKLMGITNTFASFAGLISVAVSGYILETTESWALVFMVAGGVTFLGLIFFLIFASGEKKFD